MSDIARYVNIKADKVSENTGLFGQPVVVFVRLCECKDGLPVCCIKVASGEPPGIVGVQFGFGHVCCARNCCWVGAVDDSEGTVSLPFFGESWPVVAARLKVPWCCESDGFPPPLMQTTVAEYVADKFAVAFVLPTPASSYELHETLRPLTEQLGVPVWTCVPFGAAAGLNVVVAEAAEAMTSSADSASAAIAHMRFMWLVLLP